MSDLTDAAGGVKETVKQLTTRDLPPDEHHAAVMALLQDVQSAYDDLRRARSDLVNLSLMTWERLRKAKANA